MEDTNVILSSPSMLMEGTNHEENVYNTVFVPRLRKRQRVEEAEAATPLAIGYWGKPQSLDGAKYDFLCIRATLKSSKQGGPEFTEEFMVDSGSDVVTARQELLDQLDLELIGTIQSRGVHTTVEKQLYKAILTIGSEEVEIEVMAEPYESVGNRVMRRFRHMIDSSVHYWLPGNMVAPSSSSGNSGEPSNTPETEEGDSSDEKQEKESKGSSSSAQSQQSTSSSQTKTEKKE